MSIINRKPNRRVNFHDGQRITESDLDNEQIYNRTIVSNIAHDFHGSGVILETPFKLLSLFDSRTPGLYSLDGISLSSAALSAGRFDGKGIFLDKNVSDPINGVRVELSLVNTVSAGRKGTKVLLIGYVYDSSVSRGILSYEIVSFDHNDTKISKNYYTNIIGVIFNNFSGGVGDSALGGATESYNVIGTTGYITISEARSLSVFPATSMTSQKYSPNIGLGLMVSSAPGSTISGEISTILSPSDSISDLYIDYSGILSSDFVLLGSSATAYGQKFLSYSDNIQRVDLALSIVADFSRPAGQEFDFSGDLVLSIYSLASKFAASTLAVSQNLIDLDPSITPLAEVSINQSTLLSKGVVINDSKSIISFDFTAASISDPNALSGINKGEYFALALTRRGDNSIGTISVIRGNDIKYGKGLLGTPITTLERFKVQDSKYFQFDPNTNRYISDSNSSLWFDVISDDVEVTSGSAYSELGMQITIPKTIPFVGSSTISNYTSGLSIPNRFNDAKNYVILEQSDKFVNYVSHSRTNNPVASRIEDSAVVRIVDENTFLALPGSPLVLATIVDQNIRQSQDIIGNLDLPGLVTTTSVYIKNPGPDLLAPSLIGRFIKPDLASNVSYRIVSADCIIEKAGDLDRDGMLTANDVQLALSLSGNSLTSVGTARSIFGGEIQLLDLISADLNGDLLIDGADIALLEDAVKGFQNFLVPADSTYLRINVENLDKNLDFPTIYTDTLLSGATASLTNSVSGIFSEQAALIIRPGDKLIIPAGGDSGTYIISNKVIEVDGITVTMGVTDLNGATPSFLGTSGLNLSVISGTEVNIYANNLNVMALPFSALQYSISQVDFKFSERLISICETNRGLESNFVESGATSSCVCLTPVCLQTPACIAPFKNQKLLPGDLYLPNGNILSEPGVMHHGDFEYVNISVPIPPGTISNCTIDLYNTFIKSVGTTCKTAAGFNAMVFSDGTYVGCEDTGSSNDIQKGRVKFSSAISSAFLFEQTNGATASPDQIFSGSAVESIIESSVLDRFTSFETWSINPLNDLSTTVSNVAASPATFSLTTISSAGTRFGRLDVPTSSASIVGDFIFDVSAIRTQWIDSGIIVGSVSSFFSFDINNIDGSKSTIKYGWRVSGGGASELFFSGLTVDAALVPIGSFDYSIPSPNDEVDFRIRRVDDVLTAYYITPTSSNTSSQLAFGQLIRLGGTPTLPPGNGTVSNISYEIEQSGTPTAGATFSVSVVSSTIKSELIPAISGPNLVGANLATRLTDIMTYTFPLSVTSNFTIVSAVLTLTTLTNTTGFGGITLTPIDMINATNLGAIYNAPVSKNISLTSSLTIPSSTVNGVFTVDIQPMVSNFLASPGHMPGQLKGILIEPATGVNSVIEFASNPTLDMVIADSLTGISFKIGISLNPLTGIATLNTKNILFDEITKENRTVVNFGVQLKKAGFKNKDIELNVSDLSKIGIGTCVDTTGVQAGDVCYFVVGSTGTGTFVEGPFPCSFVIPLV